MRRNSLSLSLSIVPIFASLFLFALPAQAALYAPGATLDPACAPTDIGCGISTTIASSTANSVPYYAANGSILSATSTVTILQNGNVGVGTTSPFTMFAVNGGGYFSSLALGTALPVSSGGTGWPTITSGAILYGNGSSALGTTSTGVNGQVLVLANGVPTWNATTTFSSGLAYSNGNVTNTGLLSLQQLGGGSAQTGAITFATSSQTTNGITTGLSITNSSGAFTFAPTISGTLSVGGGGTGSTTLTGILKGAGLSAIASAIPGTDYLAPNSLSATYPLQYSSNVFSLAFGTTTANSWSALQQFNGNASTTQFTSTGSTYLATLGGNVSIGTTVLTSGQTIDLLCSGDITTAFAAAVTALLGASGTGPGGTIQLSSGSCYVTDLATLPNTGASNPTQPPLRITGQGASANGYWTALPSGGTYLDLRGNDIVGKIDTRGAGMLQWDNMTVFDSGSDCAAFLHTTNTTVMLHDLAFIGTASGKSACNDIVLGGTGADGLLKTNDPNAPFQGYHSEIRNVFFSKFRSLMLQKYANAVKVEDNTWSLDSGSGDPTIGAVTLTVASGNYLAGNLVESRYFQNSYVVGAGSNNNSFIGNSTYDGTCEFGNVSYATPGGLNDFSLGAGTCNNFTDSYMIKVQIDGTGTPDTFRWARFVNGSGNWVATGIAITGANQTLTLADGSTIQIKFAATTGHRLNDNWLFYEGLDQSYSLMGSANTIIPSLDTFGGAAEFGIGTPKYNLVLSTTQSTSINSPSYWLPKLAVGGGVQFSAGAGVGGAGLSAGLSWLAANKLGVGNGTIGDYSGTLIAGNVGIGTTSPATKLEVGGNTANVTLDGYLNCSGFTSNANGLLACTASDQRLKQEIVPLDASSTLAALDSLNPVSFYWKPDTQRGTQQQYGLIAQQVAGVFPNLVSTSSPTDLTPDGTLTVNYDGLIAPLIMAVQYLSNEISGFAQSITTAVLNATTVNTQKLCVGSTCINQAQLQQLLQQAGQSSASQSSSPIIITDAPVASSSDATASTTVQTSTNTSTTSDTITATDSSASSQTDTSASTTSSN